MSPLRLALSLFAALVVGGVLTPVPVAAADAGRSTWDESRLDVASLEAALMLALRAEIGRGVTTAAVDAEVVDLRAVPDSAAGLAVDGVGRLRVAAGAWIPMRFDAGYDLATGKVQGMRLRPVAATAPAPRGALESVLVERVQSQVATRILSEFPEQRLDVAVVELEPTSAGANHAAFRGLGWVEFDGEGQAPLEFSAIFDTASGLLVAFDYSLEVVGAHGEAAASSGSLAAAR